jgi:hypothetical protein
MIDLTRLRALIGPDTTAGDPADGLLALAKTLRPTGTVAKRRTPGIERVALDDLQVDHDYQRPPDREKINEFRQTLRAGSDLPAIKVNRRPDGTLWITDGQHRAAAATLEGHAHIDARVTHVPTWEEPQEAEIVTKVHADHEDELVATLRGAGARRVGKRLVLNLGNHGEVTYAPHRADVGKTERGVVCVNGGDVRKVLDRLDLSSLVATTAVE